MMFHDVGFSSYGVISVFKLFPVWELGLLNLDMSSSGIFLNDNWCVPLAPS